MPETCLNFTPVVTPMVHIVIPQLVSLIQRIQNLHCAHMLNSMQTRQLSTYTAHQQLINNSFFNTWQRTITIQIMLAE